MLCSPHQSIIWLWHRACATAGVFPGQRRRCRRTAGADRSAGGVGWVGWGGGRPVRAGRARAAGPRGRAGAGRGAGWKGRTLLQAVFGFGEEGPSDTALSHWPPVPHPAPHLCVCFFWPSGAGTQLPGSDAAVAEGNSLGKGAMLFHLPQARFRRRCRALSGAVTAPPRALPRAVPRSCALAMPCVVCWARCCATLPCTPPCGHTCTFRLLDCVPALQTCCRA